MQVLAALHAERAHRRATLLARALGLWDVHLVDHARQILRDPNRLLALDRHRARRGARQDFPYGCLGHLDDHTAIGEQAQLIDVDDFGATSELVFEQPMQLRFEGLDQLLLLQQHLVQDGYVAGQRCGDWHALILTKPSLLAVV